MAVDGLTLVEKIQIFMFALLIGGGLAAWARISIRLACGQQLLPPEPRRPAPWNLGHLVAIVAVYFLLQAGGVLIVHGFFPTEPVQQLEAKPVAETAPEPAEKIEPSEDNEQPADVTKVDQVTKESDEANEPLNPRKIATSILAHISISLLSLAIAVPLIRLTTRCTWSDLGIVPGKILSDIKLGLTGFAAAAAPIYGLQFVLSRYSTKRHPIIDWLEKNPDLDFLLLAGVSTVLIAPLAEEFFFRLVFQGWLENIVSYLWPSAVAETPRPEVESRQENAPIVATSENPYASPLENPPSLPPASGQIHSTPSTDDVVPPGGMASWGPIVCSALIFALMHFDHGPAPIPLFFLALLLGYLYQRTHRILPSIVVHCCLNGCSMLILWTSLWK